MLSGGSSPSTTPTVHLLRGVLLCPGLDREQEALPAVRLYFFREKQVKTTLTVLSVTNAADTVGRGAIKEKFPRARCLSRV